MSRRLENLATAITGANRGIGRAIAEAFAAEGASLFLLDRDTGDCAEIVAAAREHGVEGDFRQMDVTRPEEIEAAMAAAEARFGKIDVLVNCAGIFQAYPLLEYPLEEWNRLMEINVTGTLLASQAALRRMVPRGRGKVINLSSIAGKTGGRNRAAYYASKHAVIGLTRCMALEMAEHNIAVNAICPGMVDTELFDGLLADTARVEGEADPEQVRAKLLQQVPLGRMIEPKEVAHLAVYLASPESDTMTGQALTISGGRLMA